MREIVVLSGKGGTGKTSIMAAFATIAHNSVIVDCDVDASDLHLILQPNVNQTHEFIASETAHIDQNKCSECGLCLDLCRFKAISGFVVNERGCEGCGVCAEFCPFEAIEMRETSSGYWYKSDTRVGQMFHARLKAGGENSGKLVTQIRKAAKSAAQESGSDYIIIDGPPGIGCPVIASMTGADQVIIVTEPTVSGVHDLERIAKLAAHFNMSAGIIINKCDINLNKADEIESFAAVNAIPVFGRIPYDTVVTAAQIAGTSITEYSDGTVGNMLVKIWGRLFPQTRL